MLYKIICDTPCGCIRKDRHVMTSDLACDIIINLDEYTQKLFYDAIQVQVR